MAYSGRRAIPTLPDGWPAHSRYIPQRAGRGKRCHDPSANDEKDADMTSATLKNHPMKLVNVLGAVAMACTLAAGTALAQPAGMAGASVSASGINSGSGGASVGGMAGGGVSGSGLNSGTGGGMVSQTPGAPVASGITSGVGPSVVGSGVGAAGGVSPSGLNSGTAGGLNAQTPGAPQPGGISAGTGVGTSVVPSGTGSPAIGAAGNTSLVSPGIASSAASVGISMTVESGTAANPQPASPSEAASATVGAMTPGFTASTIQQPDAVVNGNASTFGAPTRSQAAGSMVIAPAN
jgi:hypothetical protein